jgi:hypothetical protein
MSASTPCSLRIPLAASRSPCYAVRLLAVRVNTGEQHDVTVQGTAAMPTLTWCRQPLGARACSAQQTWQMWSQRLELGSQAQQALPNRQARGYAAAGAGMHRWVSVGCCISRAILRTPIASGIAIINIKPTTAHARSAPPSHLVEDEVVQIAPAVGS